MRRARSALATALLLATAVPGTLAAGEQSAAASTSQAGSGPVSLVITGMSPTWAGPRSTITITGTVRNTSHQVLSDLSVELRSSRGAVGSLTAMLDDLANPGPLATNPIAGHVSAPSGTLPPGASSSWTITFPAKQIGMSAFGVYPLTAAVSSLGNQLTYQNTFLPYVPSRHGRHASRPVRQQITWLWPLIATPLTALPGPRDCSGPEALQLGASMAQGGRLNELLSVGGKYAAADKLTWAVDPALLSAASGLTSATCNSAAPGQAKAAAAWLSQLRKTTASQPLFATPYANVSLALIRQGHASDVDKAFQLGRAVGSDVLHRDVAPSTASRAGNSADDGSIAWPPNNISSDTLLQLAQVDDVRTVVLDSAAVIDAPGSLFQVPEQVAGNVHVLLSASSLTQLLSAAVATAGSQFATSQEFLAETALMAKQGKANPIVVAPPQRWQPSAGLATALLSGTARAPWLAPVSVTSLSQHAKITDQQLKTNADGTGAVSGSVLRQLRLLDQDALQIAEIQSRSASSLPTTAVDEAIFALESSAWSGRPKAVRMARLVNLANYLDSLQHEVVVVADGRVTLGGLKGNVPVLIHNELDFPVEVQLIAKWDQPAGGGLTVHQHPRGLVTVQPHSQVQTTLHVQATQVGSSTITLRLLNQAGQALPNPPVYVTVQATQFGMFAMILLASVLGVFMIVSAGRAIRRGRPTPPDDSGDPGHKDSDAGDEGQQPPRPDTVVPEHSELGAAGTSGL